MSTVSEEEELHDIKKDPTASKYFKTSTKWITGNFISTILDEMEMMHPNDVLDIGCGTAYITYKMVNHTNTIIGSDLDYDRLLLARDLYRGRDLPLAASTAANLPFPTDSFEVVTAFEMLEHIIDLDPVIKEIKRVAKSKVLITVPNEPFFRMMNFFRGKNVSRWGNDEGHVNHFNTRKLKKLLSIYFSKVEVRRNAFVWLIAKCEI